MSSPALPYLLALPSGAKIAIAAIEPRKAGSTLTKREAERASWHAVARELLGDPTAEFEYTPIGAPRVVGSPIYIGVSHSSTLVAVIIAPHPCAIDIESIDRNFDKVADRYISAAEQGLITAPEDKALIWSTKEALYKYSGRKGLTLLDDIRIASLGGEEFTASLAPHTSQITGHATTIFNHSLAYIG